MSIRDTIAKTADITVEQYEIPEWGVTLELRQFDLDARARFAEMSQELYVDGKLIDGGYARSFIGPIIGACFDPETGEPVFTDGDEALIRSKNGKIVERLRDRIFVMNGLDREAIDAGKDGSSTPTSDLNDGSGSDSPPGSA